MYFKVLRDFEVLGDRDILQGIRELRGNLEGLGDCKVLGACDVFGGIGRQGVRKYGKTVDIRIIYGQFIVMSKDCRESNVQRASFMLKVESGDSAKLSLSSGTKYS